jgi:hypothetical protein
MLIYVDIFNKNNDLHDYPIENALIIVDRHLPKLPTDCLQIDIAL